MTAGINISCGLAAGPPLTSGTLLGGRVAYRQPVTGYRTGIEPVLLAASVPALPGDHVVEAGTGAGAGLLALAVRVGGLTGCGIERDPVMAALAGANLSANGCSAIEVIAADVTGWNSAISFDHAFANPPWHDARGTPPPDKARRQAKMAEPGLLDGWCSALAAALRHRGTLTLILPAALLTEGVAALARAHCGETTILPLWPRAGEPARLVILRGVRHGRGAGRLLPGLVLHAAGGFYTPEAEHVLRSGAGLPMEG